jgi:anti-anti-sigma factor
MPTMCAVIGDIDMASVRSFSAELHDAIDTSDQASIDVDCSGITFMGSSGYRALVEANYYAHEHGHTLTISNMSSSCALLIELCNKDDELTCKPQVRTRMHPRGT